jgi:hypothetical protein
LPGCRNIAAELRDELLNGEVFYSLKEAHIVIEQWRKHDNKIRPHNERVTMRDEVPEPVHSRHPVLRQDLRRQKYGHDVESEHARRHDVATL